MRKVISETEVEQQDIYTSACLLVDTFDSVHRHVAALLAHHKRSQDHPSFTYIPKGTGLLSTRHRRIELGRPSARGISNNSQHSHLQSPLSSHRYRLDANQTSSPYELILLVRSTPLPPCPPLSTRSTRGTVGATMSSAKRTDSLREQRVSPRSCPGTDTKRYVRPAPACAAPVTGS